VLAAVVVAVTVVATGGSGSSAPRTTTTPPCGWATVVSSHPALGGTNVFFPDLNTSYWYDGRPLARGEALRVDGHFADARYQSLVTYDAGRVLDAVSDEELRPRPGSTNPTSHAVDDPTEERYRVFVGGWPTPWPDTPSWARPAVRWAFAEGVATGIGGSFRPGAPSTRLDVAGWLWRASGRPGGHGHHRWTDVARSSPVLRWLWAEGLAGRRPGPFRPEASLRRVEAVRWLWRLAGAPGGHGAHGWSDVPAANPAFRWLWAERVADRRGGPFRPQAPLSRGLAALWTWRVLGSPRGPDNHLRAHPAGAGGAGLVATIHRIYLPDDPADPFGGASLPRLTLLGNGGRSQVIPPCGPAARSVGHDLAGLDGVAGPVGRAGHQAGGRSGERGPASPLAAAEAFRRVDGGSAYPTPHNAYLASSVGLVPGEVIIVRGRAPTAPDTRAGALPADPATPTDLRYWSLCQGVLAQGWRTAACAHDQEFPLDESGRFTAVVSYEADRPANSTVEDGVVWLNYADVPVVPGSFDAVGVLIYRHLIDNGMTGSVHDVPPGSDAATAATIMGEYYPRAWRCPVSVFASGGPGGGVSACLGTTD